jgi:hypothetical protein
MSRLSGATLLLSAVSIAQAQNCVPIGADATDDAVVGTGISQSLVGGQPTASRRPGTANGFSGSGDAAFSQAV